MLDGKLKAGRHDANHRVQASIRHDGVPEHIHVAAEMLLPEIMADDDFEATGSTAALFVSAGESATDLRFDPEHIEEFRADFCTVQAAGSLLTCEGKGTIAIDRAAREG